MKNQKSKIKNPTSEQFKTVINNFISVLPKAEFENSLNMRDPELAASEESICCTPMCHGGWYAVSNGIYSLSLRGALTDRYSSYC